MKVGEMFKYRDLDIIVTITEINSQGIIFEYTREGNSYHNGMSKRSFLQAFIPLTELYMALL
jgi:hypothetical protein